MKDLTLLVVVTHERNLNQAVKQLHVYRDFSGCSERMLLRWLGGEVSTCQCRRHKRHRFDPWVRKIPLEEGMATHTTTLAWRIPWTVEPGRLLTIGSQRISHD